MRLVCGKEVAPSEGAPSVPVCGGSAGAAHGRGDAAVSSRALLSGRPEQKQPTDNAERDAPALLASPRRALRRLSARKIGSAAARKVPFARAEKPQMDFGCARICAPRQDTSHVGLRRVHVERCSASALTDPGHGDDLD